MFQKFFDKYGEPSHKIEIIESDRENSKKLLPAEINELLSRGTGSYLNNFFWIVNPSEFNPILYDAYEPIKKPSICFARDAFANLYTWEDNTIYCINISYHSWKVVGRKPSVFFGGILTDWEYFSKQINAQNYEAAKNELGPVGPEECYGYFPLPSLGGNSQINNIKKVKLKEYISIATQALGRIE